MCDVCGTATICAEKVTERPAWSTETWHACSEASTLPAAGTGPPEPVPVPGALPFVPWPAPLGPVGPVAPALGADWPPGPVARCACATPAATAAARTAAISVVARTASSPLRARMMALHCIHDWKHSRRRRVSRGALDVNNRAAGDGSPEGWCSLASTPRAAPFRAGVGCEQSSGGDGSPKGWCSLASTPGAAREHVSPATPRPRPRRRAPDPVSWPTRAGSARPRAGRRSR